MLKLLFYIMMIPLYIAWIFIRLMFFPLTVLCGVFKELEKYDHIPYYDDWP